MEGIKIVDDFLTDEEYWKINCDANDFAWVTQKTKQGSLEFLMKDVSNDEYYSEKLFDRLKKKLDVDVSLLRVYFNGQFSGRDGTLHRDGCDITALIYISEYDPEWGGFTQILHPDDKQDIVAPVQGRLLLFPGNTLHKGYSYCYQTCPMRISLAYKINLI